MDTKHYLISFARVSMSGNRVINIVPVHKMADVDHAMFLRISGILSYFDPHQPNTVQTIDDDGSISLSLIPPEKELASVRDIADTQTDEDLKTFIGQFAHACAQAHQESDTVMLCVQIRFKANTQQGSL